MSIWGWSGCGSESRGVRDQVSGVRCQGSGVRCQMVSPRASLLPTVYSLQSPAFFEVSGIRCQVIGVRWSPLERHSDLRPTAYSLQPAWRCQVSDRFPSSVTPTYGLQPTASSLFPLRPSAFGLQSSALFGTRIAVEEKSGLSHCWLVAIGHTMKSDSGIVLCFEAKP
jgi:hypothetical protein